MNPSESPTYCGTRFNYLGFISVYELAHMASRRATTLNTLDAVESMPL